MIGAAIENNTLPMAGTEVKVFSTIIPDKCSFSSRDANSITTAPPSDRPYKNIPSPRSSRVSM